MTAPARTAAYKSLRAILLEAAQPAAALTRVRDALKDERDRALTTDVVTGTLRWQRALDARIEQAARRPVTALDADVLVILRLSLYQLLHLDRVPAAAVVDDAVNLTRYARKTSAAGFVNAVLRSLSRQPDLAALPPRPASAPTRADALAYLGITQSHPDWLAGRWLDRYGFEHAAAWVEFDNTTPAATLRVNTLTTTREALQHELRAAGVETEPTRFAPHGLTVTSGRLPAPRGLFTIQDEASQLVALTVGAAPGDTVLDLCAAPGGKTTAIAAAMHGSGMVVACDARSARVRLLRDTVRASGAPNVRIAQVDGRTGLPFAAAFDRILVDAPCSGLGTVRRDPDIKWRRTEDQLQAFASDQTALLTNAAAALKPGGRLVYATCSSEPEENDAIVDAFLASHPAFHIDDLRDVDGGQLAPVTDARGVLRTLPFVHGLEAFFAAALVSR